MNENKKNEIINRFENVLDCNIFVGVINKMPSLIFFNRYV